MKKRQDAEELHKPARINFKRRRVTIKSLFDLYQADLVEMLQHSKENNGYKYMLVLVWAFPLKTKTGNEVSKAMEKLVTMFVYQKLEESLIKKYLPNWTTEIFTIRKVQLTNPTTYLLKDENNQDILGGFYEEQLQKVKYPDVYFVEKILKRSKDKVYVKWLGLDNKHNSWISNDNVL
ncbi:hypothetical protein NQ318_007483 [Aromia moschata]|uniref:Chromo domain-containing protein n=1 Tax=Aromia moschata TaxID=1265417 RepID=A0AAV8YFW3_9CUCU|nr:hypothetical protein NQ318_007483 [Aromia moschata]